MTTWRSIVRTVKRHLLRVVSAAISQCNPSIKMQMTDWQTMGADKKATAGICAILLGWFGVHKFILGTTPKE
jgi:hypothetical protein